MPVGAAIAVGATVSAGAGIYSANEASDTAAKANAQNQADINKTQAANTALYAPYVSRGNSAGDEINALLGLPTSQQDGSASGSYSDYLAANPDIAKEAQRVVSDGEFPTVQAYLQYHDQNFGSEGRNSYTDASKQPATANDNSSATNAFNTYLNSTGHQFRLKTGSDAINTNAATAGLLDSGSTLKALTQYGQNVGTQDFQNYLGNLQGQQSTGLTATGGTVSNNTNAIGQTVASNDSAATAAANADLATGSDVSNAVGQALQAYGYSKGASSYGKKTGT